jgi:hypothetical protein
MDLYTCQSDIDRIVVLLKHAFQLAGADVLIQDRWVRYPVGDVKAVA